MDYSFAILTGSIIYVVFSVVLCFQESKLRKIKLVSALLLLFFLPPPIGYYLIINKPVRSPIGCPKCGNKELEVLNNCNCQNIPNN
jgi:hypothetical protein